MRDFICSWRFAGEGAACFKGKAMTLSDFILMSYMVWGDAGAGRGGWGLTAGNGEWCGVGKGSMKQIIWWVMRGLQLATSGNHTNIFVEKNQTVMEDPGLW